ncbi:unnamed protein product [Nezara viridula]|uniref:Uncharacterized protein n=1 Tax=Nezara viridula TaxID=85310 RepID=A0A9P0HDW5_NEZVI|nr:unnamed protein product [Nezara viridula]
MKHCPLISSSKMAAPEKTDVPAPGSPHWLCNLTPTPAHAVILSPPLNYYSAGFCSSSQSQFNLAVIAKEHSRVHLCLGLVPRKP